jgi:F0F1-type ATP synthase gamma subunit
VVVSIVRQSILDRKEQMRYYDDIKDFSKKELTNFVNSIILCDSNANLVGMYHSQIIKEKEEEKKELIDKYKWGIIWTCIVLSPFIIGAIVGLLSK